MMRRKIYVASSWRNGYYPEVVTKLREAGHEVYDFRNPPSGDPGFKWSGVSEDYMEWTPEQYRDMLGHPKAERQFHNDIEAMEGCAAIEQGTDLSITNRQRFLKECCRTVVPQAHGLLTGICRNIDNRQ